MTVVVRDADRAEISTKAFAAHDVCRGGTYAAVTATGVLDRDQLVYVSVETADIDLWIDRVDLLLAYEDAPAVMAASDDTRRVP